MGINATMYLPFSNWSLKPSYGEPAHGYFLRLVANEGHYSASVYANEIGLNGRRLKPEETLGALLALPIGDEHKKKLRHYTPIADGPYYDLGGQRLRQRQMSFSTRRFCRACLSDSPHHRVWWDILAFRTCPEHGTAIEDLDAFGQPIGWWWADIASDTGGNPLAAWAPPHAARHGRTLEAFILERLGAASETQWPLLGQYPLYDVIEVAAFLGRWLGHRHSIEPPPESSSDLNIGMAALAGSQEDLVMSLRAWFNANVTPDIRRQGRMLSQGWSYIAPVNALRTSAEVTIWKLVQAASVEAFEPIGRMGKRRFKETADFYCARALSLLASELGVRVEALVPLARHLGIVPAKAEPWELSPEKTDTLRRGVADLIPSSEVTSIVGLQSWEWQDLVGTGRLASFGYFAMGNMYLRSEVESFVRETLAKLPVRVVEAVSLRTYARRNGLSVSTALTQVLDGGIAAVRAVGCPDFLAIRVIAKSMRRKASRSVDESAERDVVTMAEAAAMVQLNHQAINRLVGLGVLEKARGSDLSRASVIDFHRRFANARIYRSAIGGANHVFHDRLAAMGVSSYFGLRGSNVVVERAVARRVLGLACDPDDPRVAGNDIWEEFKVIVSERCPVFTLPPAVSEVGAKLRTATRKVVVDVSMDTTTGAISLGFDLHPEMTCRRWKLFEKREAEIKQALERMTWQRSGDGAGWRLTLVSDDRDLYRAADALANIHKYFK